MVLQCLTSHRRLSMKLHCVNSRIIPLIFANTMTTSERRGGHTSRWRELSSRKPRLMSSKKGEVLAIFERDLIIHFQQIAKAAALYVRALLGGVRRALEVYRRVDGAANSYPWSLPTTEEAWHAHAEGVLMVAPTNLNLPPEAWRSARLLRAVPNCRLVLTLAYHMLSPALSIEEVGLTTYLQTPLMQAGPSVLQATTGELEVRRKALGSD